MRKNLRQYLYADVDMINSFFNQFYPDVKLLEISKSKVSHTNLDAKVELPSILQGFLKGNFSGEYGRDRGHSTSIQVEVPLEEKIRLLCSKAIGTETSSIVLPKQDMETLILGNILIISERSLEESILDCLIQHGYSSLDEFYDICLQEKMSALTWEQIVDIGKEYCRSGNHMSVMRLVDYFDRPEKKGVESFLVMNSVFPIRVFLSSNKLLASESSFRAARIWHLKSNTNVLGILYKLSSKMYTLKPLALWTIVDYSSYTENEKYEIEHFGDYI